MAKKRGPGRPKGSKNKPKKETTMVTPALGLTLDGRPRQRREKLSAHVRQIEHNCLIHIRRDVRHTGRGWLPLYLDPAWDAAVKRMLKDGILVEDSELGGYVPSDMVLKMKAQNAAVMNAVRAKSGKFRKAVKMDHLGREGAAALGRLVIAGLLEFDPATGYSVP